MAKRRSNGEGSITRHHGSWRAEIMDGYTEDGKRKRVRFSGATKGEVLQKIREYKNLAEEHVHLDKSVTFGSWADQWYEDYRSQVQPSTYSSYRYTLTILKREFSDKPLCDILPLHINRFQDKLLKVPYSMSQISKCRAMLVQIFDAAAGNGLISRNPARYAKRPRTLDLDQENKKDAFTKDEERKLLADLPHDLLGYSIRLLLGTGIRVQELLALQIQDIAEDGSSVSVNKAIKTVDGIPTVGPPKSKRGIRTIPIPSAFQESAIYLRTHGGSPYIWSVPHSTTPCYSVGNFRRRYYRAIKAVGGVRCLPPHCCRHTYVTRLQENGVALELIARLAGHSSIITTDGYAHTSQKTLLSAVETLSDNFESSKEE